MAYLRWSFSQWYVYAHVDGGLWIGFAGGKQPMQHVHLDTAAVQDFLSGGRPMEEIPGWNDALPSERKELLWAMRDYVADEKKENLHAPMPNIRQMLRKYEEDKKDKDPKGL